VKFMWEITWAYNKETGRFHKSENVILYIGDDWYAKPKLYASPISMTFCWLNVVLCFNGRLTPLPAWWIVKLYRKLRRR